MSDMSTNPRKAVTANAYQQPADRATLGSLSATSSQDLQGWDRMSFWS